MTPHIGAAISSSLLSSVGVKIVSFLVSTLIVRNSSASDFGKISVNFQLVVSLSLFILKEGVRRSAMRCPSLEDGRTMIWIGHILTSFIIIPSVLIGYMRLIEQESWLVQLLLSVSLWVESFAEIILFEQASVKKNLSIRNISETWAALSSSLALFLSLLAFHDGSTAFVISHNVFSILLLILASRNLSIHKIVANAPIQLIKASFRRSEITTPLAEMSLISVQKLFLTEGERILTLAYLPANSVGQLGLVNNAGSLVLRIFFAPIEDIAFNAFTKCSDPEERIAVLKSVLFLEVTIALLGIAFGIPLSHSVVYLLYGPHWAEQPSVILMLQFYCVLLLLFALNGSMEAYYVAVASSKQLRWSLVSQWVVFASLAVTVFLASPLGALAILIGNGVSMMVRIGWCFTVFSSFSDPFHPLLFKVLSRSMFGGLLCHFTLSYTCEYLLATLPSPNKRHFLNTCIVGAISALTIISIFPSVRTALNDLKKKQQ